MYALLRTLTLQQLVLQQVPALTLALLTAELFYKFHSFTLECVAFLFTWFFIDSLMQVGVRIFRKSNRGDYPDPGKDAR